MNPFAGIKRLRQKALVLRAFKIMVDDPTQTERVLALFDGKLDARPDALAFQVARAKAAPEVAERFAERYGVEVADHDVEQLLRCPEGSLGREYALHLERMGVPANPFHRIPVDDDASYLKLRCRQTHDLVHVLLGAGIRPADEVHVQAFVFAQTSARVGPYIFAMAYLHTLLKRPAAELIEITERLIAGYQLGQQAGPFLALRYEERWEEPLEQVREALGLPQVPAASPEPAGSAP